MDTAHIREMHRRDIACKDRYRNLILLGIVFIIVSMLVRSHSHQHEDIKYMKDSLSNFYKDFDPAVFKDMDALKDLVKKTSEELIKPIVGLNELNDASDRAGSHLQTLQNFYHDKTGRPDLALGASGGRIAGIGADTEPFYSCNAFWKLLGCPNKIYGPEKIIEKFMEPGECFRFKGQKATVFIRLLADAFLNAATIEHITPQLSLTGDILSAPRVFNVSGFNKKNDVPFFFGRFEFNPNKTPIETFEFPQRLTIPFRYVKVDFEENNGANETCVYRFRVHGIIQKS